MIKINKNTLNVYGFDFENVGFFEIVDKPLHWKDILLDKDSGDNKEILQGK